MLVHKNAWTVGKVAYPTVRQVSGTGRKLVALRFLTKTPETDYYVPMHTVNIKMYTGFEILLNRFLLLLELR